jgi:hypothetical protein
MSDANDKKKFFFSQSESHCVTNQGDADDKYKNFIFQKTKFRTMFLYLALLKVWR